QFPFISLLLPFSFPIYPLLKNILHIHPITTITIQSILTAPPPLIYLIYLSHQQHITFPLNISSFSLLFSPPITPIPFILFSPRANPIPLSLTRFIQYLAPTIIFILPIFLFKHPFNTHQFITFIFICIG
ncbi:EamA family transporter, partial [Staphylococcus epidermidis]